MKRKIIILSCLLLFFVICIGVVPYKNRVILQNRFLITWNLYHDRNKVNSTQFNSKANKLGGLTLAIEESIYNKKSQKELSSIVRDDLISIKELFGPQIEGTLYVMPENYSEHNVEKNCVYTTYNEVRSGEYLKKYADSVMIKSGEWKKYAFKDLVRGKSNKKKRIIDVVNKTENKNITSLFPFFLDKRCFQNYTDGRLVASDYGRWVFDNYGKTAFLVDRGDNINSYLKDYLGTNIREKVDEAYKKATEFKIDDSDTLKIYDKEFTLNFSEDFSLDSERNYDVIVDVLRLKKRIQRTLVDLKLVYKSKLNNKNRVTIKCVGERSVNVAAGNTIYIRNGRFKTDVLLHELTHVYTNYNYSDNTNAWLVEGVAVYVEALVEKTAVKKGEINENSYYYYAERDTHCDEDERFYSKLIKIYKKKNGEIDNNKFNIFDFISIGAGLAIDYKDEIGSGLMESNFFLSVMGVYEEGGLKQLTDNQLNKLSYYQSALLVDYLIETKKQDSILKYIYNQSDIKSAFGQTEDELYDSFVKWIKRKYVI